MKTNRPRWAIVTFILIIITCGCSEAPRHTLSEAEKREDLTWLFARIEENYAPMQMKAQKFKLDIPALKQKYLEDSRTTKTNEEFYLLLNRAVAELKDAHTSLQAPMSALRNKVRTAYLGFDGERKGEHFVVKKLLPTIVEGSGYPIKVDDEIIRMDGLTLSELVKRDLVPYRDLGNDDANFTNSFPKLFNRLSPLHPFPKNVDAVLTIKRKDRELTVTLPWVQKDLFDFTQEQAAAEREKSKQKPTTSASLWGNAEQALVEGIKFKPSLIEALTGKRFWDHFLFFDNSPTWGSPELRHVLADAAGKPETSTDRFKEERNVPPGAIFVGDGNPFVAYVFPEKLPKKDKEPQRYRSIGYLYLNTFSPDVQVTEPVKSSGAYNELMELKVVGEINEIVTAFKGLGVKHVIVDLINNGGGSLTLGMRIAQQLFATKLIYPEIQFRTNDSWLDIFENTSLHGLSDSEREVARRVLGSLQQDRDQGLALSRKFTIDSLAPFRLSVNENLEENFDFYLLVNESCASMCDIFSAMLKENKAATLVGARPMGAGGSVRLEGELPHSRFVLQQTQSLLVQRDGSYLENNGAEPDEKMDVSSTATEKYDAVRKKAVELILKKP